ncbi:FAD-dependent oxidoreductase [Thermomonas sp.]|uniref:NAD(P)/FAD-dependent oxidoreductase n=1 Tax=Pseudomonadota TaxID=1224 RepID=UPI001ACADB9E|nr:FAD-dependent oxidoreductase [Thermomonas sp.]MBN9576316.1 FAD-binding oxidoreductase [Alicycliphilus denitrificans]HRO64465.1 FAD-dependent oxidoreductase [Thermomonas sp.]
MSSNGIIVVGGGLVGAAIAYGAAKSGSAVTLLDQGDVAYRASRGNFGLVWLQSKGAGFPRYARWSRDAVDHWGPLASELRELTGVDVDLQQNGGFWIGFSEKEVAEREAMLAKINAADGRTPFEMLDHRELKARLPAIGPKVAGGSWCPLDGHANPLKLLHALHAGIQALGGRICNGADVAEVCPLGEGRGFRARGSDGRQWIGEKIVLAAGLSNSVLAPQLGLHAPVVPNRGQVLITERLKKFLPHPTNKARQTAEGTVQLGFSVEDVGLDDGTTVAAIEWIAKRAVATFPILSSVKLVRAWGALRVMTPDGSPIYQESARYPGAFTATSHSGVSLAGSHAYEIGPWIAGVKSAPEGIEEFAGERFLDPDRKFSNAH